MKKTTLYVHDLVHTTIQHCKLQSKLSDRDKLFQIKSLTNGSSLTHFGM